ncbi:MAG: MFS transporter [Planctomycetes bacterium]|nr:MFS transporter [Planctomycetota bacterium]
MADDGTSDLLRQRSFALYLLARVAGGLAGQMQVVAVGWQLYDLTHSPLDLGLVGLVQFLPAVLLTLPAGHVADRYDRRLVLAGARLMQIVALATLALGSAQGWLDKPMILGITALLGVARPFEMSTSAALLATLVTPARFPRAVAVSASSMQGAVLAGPALGGLAYGLGAAAAYAACLVVCAVALVALLRIRMPEAGLRAKEPVRLRTMFAGIAFIRSQPVLLGAIALDLFAVLLGGAVALLPVFARDILQAGPVGLGLLRSAEALGALVTALLLTRFPITRRAGPIMLAAVAVFGVATIAFGLSRSFPLSVAALAVLGAADMVSVVIRSALVQLETPDSMRGRVSAINSLFIGTSNQLGEFESGVTAALFGTVPAVVLGGAGTLAVVALWVVRFPTLAKRDRLVPESHAPQT